MTEKPFAMINKMSPNFKPCQDQNKLIEDKKVIAHLTLPCHLLDVNLFSSKKSMIHENKELLEIKKPTSTDLLQKYAMTLITKFKWQKNEGNCDELMISKENKPFVEILAFKKHSSDKYWMIPSGHSKLNNQKIFNGKSIEKKCPKKQDLLNEKYNMVNDLYKKIFINSKIIYKGYLNDGKKKENSLIEVIAENCHHFNDQIVVLIEQVFQQDFSSINYCLKWVDIYEQNFYPPHRYILKKCAKFLNAEWID